MSVITMQTTEEQIGNLPLPQGVEDVISSLRQDVSDINDNVSSLSVADTTDTTTWVVLTEDQTGTLAPKSDGGLTYNASTGTLTATAFSGPLTGTASVASTVTVADSTDATSFIAMVDSATGNLAVKTDGALLYDASNGTLQTALFNATSGVQVAPSQDILQNYKVGTFTPTIIGASTAGVGTYSIQVGRYIRIGDMVWFNVALAWSAHTGTGLMRVAGLPFTASSDDVQERYVVNVLSEGMTKTANTAIFNGLVTQGTTQVRFVESDTTGTDSAWADITMDTSVTSFYVTGCYTV